MKVLLRRFLSNGHTLSIWQGSKLRLIQSPVRLTFSPWPLKILVNLVATLATKFLYDLDLNETSKVKTNIHLILLCFRHKKCAKSHKQSQFTSKFIPTSVRKIFKQSNLMDRVVLSAAAFTLYKLATKFFQLVTIGDQRIFLNFEPCLV